VGRSPGGGAGVDLSICVNERQLTCWTSARDLMKVLL